MSENKDKICIRRALISVFDKTGLEKIVRCMGDFNIEIISSGGTAGTIRSLGCDCIDVSTYTGYPESPDGLIKTLHPRIHGGLLLDPGNPAHNKYMKMQSILPIDLVIVNLYPFTKAAADLSSATAQVHEMIDIGGPAMLRASAKGALLHGRPCVIVDPKDYLTVIIELKRTKGCISSKLVRELAVKAFKKTANYDAVIIQYLNKSS